jgi:hypothetical protein
MGWIAGEDDPSITQLGCRVSDGRDLFLMSDEQDSPAVILERADDVDDVVDREHVDSRGGLIENRQRRFHRQHGRQLDSMTFSAAEGLIDSPNEVAVWIQTDLHQYRLWIEIGPA